MPVQTSRPVMFPRLKPCFFCPVILPFSRILITIFPYGSVFWSWPVTRKILVSLRGLLKVLLIPLWSSLSTLAATAPASHGAKSSPPPDVHGTFSMTISHSVWSILCRRAPPSFTIVVISPFILKIMSSCAFPIIRPAVWRPEPLLRGAHWPGAPLTFKVGVKISATVKLFPPWWGSAVCDAVIMFNDEWSWVPSVSTRRVSSKPISGRVHWETLFPKVLLIPVPVAA